MRLRSGRLSSERSTPFLRWTGIVTTVGMVIVIAMGDLVTNAGAAEGCGRSWPLCHGQLVPTFTLTTLIEFSHRAVVGVVSLGVFVLAGGILLRAPWRREYQLLAPSLVLFLLLQAVLGGMAVLWPESPAILALHMGISLLSFATVLLTTVLLLEEHSVDLLRDRAIPAAFRRLAWVTMGYLYAMIYVGAFVRHSNAMLACAGWPLCNGAIIPNLGGLVWVNFAHRVTVLLGVGLFGLLAWEARPLRSSRPDLFWAATAAVMFLIVQAFGGALVVLTHMTLWSAIVHGALLTPVFGAVSYLCLHVLPRPRAAREAMAAEPAPFSAIAPSLRGAE